MGLAWPPIRRWKEQRTAAIIASLDVWKKEQRKGVEGNHGRVQCVCGNK